MFNGKSEEKEMNNDSNLIGMLQQIQDGYEELHEKGCDLNFEELELLLERSINIMKMKKYPFYCLVDEMW